MWARISTGVLVAALVGGAGLWVTWAKEIAEKPDRADVIELIETRSPYITDEALIDYVLEAQGERLDRLERKVEQVQESQAEILSILRRLDDGG